MENSSALKAFAALSQEGRLAVFRLLVSQGNDGLPAGEIARTLGVAHNTLSSQLSILVGAGLLTSRRDGRSIIYSANFDGLRALLAYLLEDCCQGAPELCNPVIAKVLDQCRGGLGACGDDEECHEAPAH